MASSSNYELLAYVLVAPTYKSFEPRPLPPILPSPMSTPNAEKVQEILQDFTNTVCSWLEGYHLSAELEEAIRCLLDSSTLYILAARQPIPFEAASSAIKFITDKIIMMERADNEQSARDLQNLSQIATGPAFYLMITQACEEAKRNRKRRLLEELALPASRRIPKEIVGFIIRCALGFEGSKMGPQPVTLKADKGVWLYGQVNRVWRGAILSDSELWARVEADWRQFGYSPRDSFRTILARSKNRPLDLAIFLDSDDSTNDDELKGVLGLAIEQAPRWRNVFIGVSDPLEKAFQAITGTYVEQMEEIDQPCFPLLQTLSIVNSWGSNALSVDSVLPFMNTRVLHQVSFFDITDVGLLQLPSQLLHFEDRGTPDVEDESGLVTRAEDLMTDMPNLISFYGPLTVPRSSDPAQIIVHDRISSFGIPEGFERAIELLRLPNLTSLRVYTSDNEQIDALRGLVQRSRCTIKTLGFYYTSVKEASSMSDWFSELSSVTTLEFLGVPDETFGNSLHGKFPHLRVVKLGKYFIKVHSSRVDDYGKFLDFLQQRLPPNGSLQELWFHWRSYLTEDEDISEELLDQAELQIRSRLGPVFPVYFERAELWQ